MKLKLVAIIGLILLIFTAGVNCASSTSSSLDSYIDAAVKSYRFSIFHWEVTSLTGRIQQTPENGTPSVADTQAVIDYFAALRQKTLSPAEAESQRGRVQSTIELQIRNVFKQDGINNPFGDIFGFSFPPLIFELAEPPHLLVVSPRGRIFEIRNILLLQDLSTDRMNEIETQVEQSGYSALVVELGGLGATFPTFVNSSLGLHGVLDTVVEEWLHQYLAFKPLGFRYVLDLLGISRNKDIITMNESLAGIVSSEIGNQVFDKYYAGYFPGSNNSLPAASANTSFDFNAAMRQIRQTVDAYLAGGQIDRAEQYMDQQRDYLQTKGYNIRKLNQAYFAFYGNYANTPAYANPIGTALKDIRGRVNSIKDFLNRVARVTSLRELQQLASRLSP